MEFMSVEGYLVKRVSGDIFSCPDHIHFIRNILLTLCQHLQILSLIYLMLEFGRIKPKTCGRTVLLSLPIRARKQEVRRPGGMRTALQFS